MITEALGMPYLPSGVLILLVLGVCTVIMFLWRIGRDL